MATALSPSSVIPTLNVEAPDFSMLTKAAASVQGRYLEGFNKYKSTLTSLMNANITSDDNKKFRSEYFKKIDEYLTNLSGIDFSNPANVSVANTLMDPLVKDKEFVTDLNFSTMQAAERSKLEQVRSSTDEKVFSQYSPTMEAAMSYAEQDMKNAKRGNGSIYKVSPQRFVPFANIQNVLNEAAAKQKLQIKEDRLTGAYIVTDVNGKQAIPNFTDWARQQLGNTYDQQLLVTGKVKVRQQIDALMQSDPNMTREQAYQQVAKDNSLAVYSNHQEYKQSLDNGVANIDVELRKIKSRNKNHIKKGSEDEQLFNQLTEVKQKYEKELADLNSNQSDKDAELQNAFQQFMNNPEYTLLPTMKDGLAKGWAQTYAMSNVEHSIQVNQKVLQDENHAWQRYMADYNYGLDLKRKQADYIIDLEKKKVDYDIFKLQEDYKAGIARDKSIFDAQLDFEKGLLGIGGGKDGGGGGVVGAGRLTKGPAELNIGTSNMYDLFQQKKVDLMDEVSSNYLDEEVLQAATHDAPNVVYPDVTLNLMMVMQQFEQYGNASSKNYAQAPKEYKDAFAKTVKFLKLINGNVTTINSQADIPTIIYNGVKGYQGNAIKWKSANDKIAEGARAFNEYKRLRNEEDKKLKAAIAQGFGTDKYWVKDDKGNLRPRTELSSWYVNMIPNFVPGAEKAEYTEADRNALLAAITPDADKFQAKTSERSSTLNFTADPKTFNFNAIGDLIAKAKKVTGIGGDGGLMKTTGEADDPFVKFQNTYRNAGAQLANYFVPDFHIAKLANGDLKVEVPFAVSSEGKIQLENAEGKTATFIVDKADAPELWKAMGQSSFLGKRYNYNVYGDLGNAYSYFNTGAKEVDWIVNGFANNNSKVPLPNDMKTHGIDDGYITFDSVKNELYAVISANGRTQSYGTGVTRNDYISNPKGMSATIDDILKSSIAVIQKAILAEKEQADQRQEVDVQQKPNNYTNVSSK